MLPLSGVLHWQNAGIGHLSAGVLEQMGHTAVKGEAGRFVANQTAVHIACAVDKLHAAAGMEYHHRIERQA